MNGEGEKRRRAERGLLLFSKWRNGGGGICQRIAIVEPE